MLLSYSQHLIPAGDIGHHTYPTTPMGRLRAANGHPQPYKVKFWGIGNEPWGEWQLGFVPVAQLAYMTGRSVLSAIGPLTGAYLAQYNGFVPNGTTFAARRRSDASNNLETSTLNAV